MKLGNSQMGGGGGKEPAVRPFATSSSKFEVTISGLREAVGKFLEKRNCPGPEEPILAPSLSSKHILLIPCQCGYGEHIVD